MPSEIKSFQLGWHPTKGGHLRFVVDGVEKQLQLTNAEVAAVGHLLKESPLYFTDGWIHTGPEAPGN